MKDYLEHTYNIVSTSLDRHLYLKQNNIKFENVDDENEAIGNNKQNDLRDALHKKKMESIEKTNPNLSSEYSEIISESLIKILNKDPRRIAFVLQKLIGQQLSNSLRVFIWSDILMRHERKKIEAGSMPVNFSNKLTIFYFIFNLSEN